VSEGDLDAFFEHQRDPEARFMAAFTRGDPDDRDAFVARWKGLVADDSVAAWTVLAGERVAGSIVAFERDGDREVSYWIGREFWGRGIATEALGACLERVAVRPIHARAARDNVASLRVLEKNGFQPVRVESAFADARGRAIEEVVLELVG
jgi:RimJ/RimL family protein N-acetyltransferase